MIFLVLGQREPPHLTPVVKVFGAAVNTELVVVTVVSTPRPGKLVTAGRQESLYQAPAHDWYLFAFPAEMHVTEVGAAVVQWQPAYSPAELCRSAAHGRNPAKKHKKGAFRRLSRNPQLRCLHLHNFFLFSLSHLFHFLNLIIGQLLDLIE